MAGAYVTGDTVLLRTDIMSRHSVQQRRIVSFRICLLEKNKVGRCWSDADMKTKLEQNERDMEHVAYNLLIRSVQPSDKVFCF